MVWWRRVGSPLSVYRESRTSACPAPSRQWKQSKDFNLLTLYFREKEMEKQVGWREEHEKTP